MDIAQRTATLSYAKRLQVGAVVVTPNNVVLTGYNGMPSGWENNCEHKIYNRFAQEVPHVDTNSFEHITQEILDEEYPFTDENGKRYRLQTKPEVLHAESNAISKLARSTESGEGATLFCTHAPCIHCAKLIYQSGISTLYYKEQYRDDSGVQFLIQGGVDVHKYSDS